MSHSGGIVETMTEVTRGPVLSVHDFAAWAPLLRLIWEENQEELTRLGGSLSGEISPYKSSFQGRLALALAAYAGRRQAADDTVRAALAADGMDSISFEARFSPDGHVTVQLLTRMDEPGCPGGASPYETGVLRVAGAVPEPFRRLPSPSPAAIPHPSADPAVVDRLVRERYPDAVGATEEEIAAAEARIGMPLPAELRALYRVIGRPVAVELPDDYWDNYEEDEDEDDGGYGSWGNALGMVAEEALCSIDGVRVLDGSTRRFPGWRLGAREASVTPACSAVQQLAGSPGWIQFADDHGSCRYAIDLSPADGGHVGQVISVWYEEPIGAHLEAGSLAAFLQQERSADQEYYRVGEPVIARAFQGGQANVDALARPGLEVLHISSAGAWEGPVSLAAFASLPRLRTLSVADGLLADPLEIGGLRHLESLEAGPGTWRVLLDAGAVPPELMYAGFTWSSPATRPELELLTSLSNEIAALWNRPEITTTVLKGDLS